MRGTEIPIGVLPLNVPTFQNNYNWIASIDAHRANGDQMRFRYIDDATDAVDPATSPDLPVFVNQNTLRRKLATFSYFHTFSARWFNETRFGYSSASTRIPAGEFEFPGLDSFPNITIEQDLDIQIGPYDDSPQIGAQNTAQMVSNFSFLSGRHTGQARRRCAQERFRRPVHSAAAPAITTTPPSSASCST